MRKQLALAIAGVTLVTSLVVPATSASAWVPCGYTPAPHDKDNSAYVHPTANAKIRTGTSTDCTAIGLLTTAQRADYYCYDWNGLSGSASHYWTYLRDVATGVTGWVRDDDLPGPTHGSVLYCF